MKKLTLLLSAIGLSVLTSFAQATELKHDNMQHYSFTYNFQQGVDPIQHQYNETRQELDYILVMDIQRQTHKTLEPMRVSQALTAHKQLISELTLAE